MVKWGPCTCRAKEVRWYITIYITLRYVHVPRTDQHIPRYVHLAIAIEVRAPTLTCVSIYLYEGSTCRYVRLNTLNVLHVHGPCFNAPDTNKTKIYIPMKTNTNCIGDNSEV